MIPLPELIRIARVLARAWSGRAAPEPDAPQAWRQFETALAETGRTRRTIQLAARHGLHFTMAALRTDLRRHLQDVSRRLEQLIEADGPAPAPGLGHWIAEARQLDAEFGAITVRWADRTLRVVTEPIVFEGVRLGPFAVEFGWESGAVFRGARAFNIIALDPNPASGRDDVVHPHVEGTRLCAGEAAEPIRHALEQGRLADAFLLVLSVLATYNPDSPYVPLEDWEGYQCSHCGHRGRPGSARQCEGCNDNLCGDCTDSCSHCSDTRCPGCLETCDACGDRSCSACLRSVDGRSLCPDCRTTCPACAAMVLGIEIEEDRCPNCVEAQTPEEAPCVPTA